MFKIFNKYIFPIFAVVYDMASLFWCYIILGGLIFKLTTIYIGNNSIGIIGGADGPTALYITAQLFKTPFLLMAIFILLCLTTCVILTVLAFKKNVELPSSILLCIFSALTFIVYLLIPANAYFASFYAWVINFPVVGYFQIIYIAVLFFGCVFSILLTVKRKG